MADRRKFPRLVVPLAASYRVEGSVLGRRTSLASLSATGASFIAEEQIDPDSRIDFLKFTLGEGPETQTFDLAARVVSCEHREGIGRGDEYLVAVEFIGQSFDQVRQINELVLAQLKSDPTPRDPRVDIERQVAVRFDRFDHFVEEVSKNLSCTGMFLSSERPRPIGTQFDFVLQLGEDFNLVQGRAEVVWTRLTSEGVDRPAGMGIRFLQLDATSENVLQRLIEAHAEASYARQIDPTDGTPDPLEATDGEIDEQQVQ